MYTLFGLENSSSSSSSSSSSRSSFITQWQLRLPVSRSFVLHCKVRCANSLNLMQIWGCEIRVWLNTSKQHPQMFAFLIPLGVSLHYEPVGNLHLSWSTYPMLGFLWGDKGCLGNLVLLCFYSLEKCWSLS